mmetsp:Transcript_2736/g.8192  ORF Transcript_2736/g.8192 Transcript_2736/m.8192 type:complete len:227 (+) Transcript_2736:963-1643(+)
MSNASSAECKQSSIFPLSSCADATACRALASPLLSPSSKAISFALLASVMASESLFATRDDWISASISNFRSLSSAKMAVASVAACTASSLPRLPLASATESSIFASAFFSPAARAAASSSLASAAASAALLWPSRARTTSRVPSAAPSLFEACLKASAAFLPLVAASSQEPACRRPSASTKSLLPSSPFLEYVAARPSAMAAGSGRAWARGSSGRCFRLPQGARP